MKQVIIYIAVVVCYLLPMVFLFGIAMMSYLDEGVSRNTKINTFNGLILCVISGVVPVAGFFFTIVILEHLCKNNIFLTKPWH